MSLSPNERIALFGTAEEVPAPRLLRAGDLSVELENGNLRRIRWGATEIIRGIAFLVRDTAWGTYAPSLSGIEIQESDIAFRVGYEVSCLGPEGTFRYVARIAGSADGKLTFTARGSPDADFPANRIGFVVLHPLESVAGQEVEVVHTDGTRETVVLPALIAPDQPASDIRAIEHQPAPGLRATILLEGDAFEMEDHRNWTDASFKTYVRPLAQPRPFITRSGEEIVQSVHLSLTGRALPVPNRVADAITVEIGNPEGRMPRIALACDGDEISEALDAAPLIREAGIRHLSVRYDPGRGYGPEVLSAFEHLREALGARLTLEAIMPGVDAKRELANLEASVRNAGLIIDAIVPVPRRDLKTRPTDTLPQGEASAQEIHTAARAAFPGTAIGVGTVATFTELNRNRPPSGLGDFVTHATCGIVHAADDRSVMETIEALPYVFRSVRAFVGPALPHRIGLAAIGADGNPYGPAVTPNPENRRVTMTRTDPRQRGAFAAAFALAYAASAAEHGVAEIVLGHIAGPLGVVDPQDGKADAQRLRPLFGIVAVLAAAEGTLRRATCVSSSSVAAVAYNIGKRTMLHLANRSGETVRVELPRGFALRSGVKKGKFVLPPYAIRSL